MKKALVSHSLNPNSLGNIPTQLIMRIMLLLYFAYNLGSHIILRLKELWRLLFRRNNKLKTKTNLFVGNTSP
jgi:hypothetical protein